MPKDAVGYHVFIDVKALHTQCWDPVLFVLYRKQVMNVLGNEIGQSVTVFSEPQKQMTHTKQRKPYSNLLASKMTLQSIFRSSCGFIH